MTGIDNSILTLEYLANVLYSVDSNEENGSR
jgi:hypothetical protein